MFKIGDKLIIKTNFYERRGFFKNDIAVIIDKSKTLSDYYVIENQYKTSKIILCSELVAEEFSVIPKNLIDNSPYGIISTDVFGAINEIKNNSISQKCNHPNKILKPLFTGGYWYCPDCKSDLGDV